NGKSRDRARLATATHGWWSMHAYRSVGRSPPPELLVERRVAEHSVGRIARTRPADSPIAGGSVCDGASHARSPSRFGSARSAANRSGPFRRARRRACAAWLVPDRGKVRRFVQGRRPPAVEQEMTLRCVLSLAKEYWAIDRQTRLGGNEGR